MNWDAIARDWQQYGNAIQRQWPELRDDRLRVVAGRRAWLADCLQECYCLSRDLAESEIDAWIEAFGGSEYETTDYEAGQYEIAQYETAPCETVGRENCTENFADHAIEPAALYNHPQN